MKVKSVRPITAVEFRYFVLTTAATVALTAHPGAAQNGRPGPQKPESHASQLTASTIEPAPRTGNPDEVRQPDIDRVGGTQLFRDRQLPEGKVMLAFNDVPVDEKIVAYIMEHTGKVVIPINLSVLKSKKFTLMNDSPVDRIKALDLLVQALRLNGIGIIETDEVVILDLIENVRVKQPSVLRADDDVMVRDDRGTYVVKIFRLKKAPAANVAEQLEDALPDYATLAVDVNSNQILLHGDVGLAQHIQTLIQELDRTYVEVRTATFRLAYADASEIADQIVELFEESATSSAQQSRPRGTQRQPTGAVQRGQPGGVQVQPTPAGLSTPGPVVEMRVTVNVKQNSVTVSAEPEKIDAIAKLIIEEWDRPRPDETAKVYVLQHTDPLKVRDLLQSLLGQGGGARPRAAGGATARAGVTPAGLSGQQSAVSEVIGDIYRIEAYPDANCIVVLSKTTEALDYLDHIIESIDQPSTVGVPVIVELKHASAVHLAEELNVLLAEAGTGEGLERPGTGLTGEGIGGIADNQAGETVGSGGAQAGAGTGGAAGRLQFPWQRARAREDQADPSSLIGKVRIVPILRQNALAILAPVAQRNAVESLIRDFDRPGRQVMISAIIAEVELTDELALGLRLSSDELVSSVSDLSLRGSFGIDATKDDLFGSLFDTSVLTAGTDINVLLQAISQKTNVRILQEPRVFTADNQEAIFFDGQDVPFITQSQTITTGGITQSFDYVAVGVQLDVRPRITVERDVDMEVRLELSSVVPGETLFGGFILDRRTTTTKVIVKNGQTIVLSGILTDSESQITRGLPLLSDIPLIGELFKSRENSKTTTELIAFITPTVVDNPSENEANFNVGERERLQDLSRPLKEQEKDRGEIRERIITPKESGVGASPDDRPEPSATDDVVDTGQEVY